MAHETYVVIMAGGKGERLFPLSTPERPKQFLNLFGTRSMLQQTVDRVLPFVPIDRVMVVTSEDHVSLVREHLPELPVRNIIGEPFGRGTAPCVAVAATSIAKDNPHAVMVSLPADHIMADEEAFRGLLVEAVEVAARGEHLVTFGIVPTRPETGYGYIYAPEVRTDTQEGGRIPSCCREVLHFAEKPDQRTAQRYLVSGSYYWNSGMFVWRVDTILEEIRRYVPDLHHAMKRLDCGLGDVAYEDALRQTYEEIGSVSIDRGVMEKSHRILLIPFGEIGWSDVGSWDALREALAIRQRPWGSEELWALNQHYAGRLLHIGAGQSLPLQCHEMKDKTICVLEGQLRLRIGAEVDAMNDCVLRAGDSRRIPPGAMHQMEALEVCVVAEVSTPHLCDAVGLQDR